jgi:hypothetical protein
MDNKIAEHESPKVSNIRAEIYESVDKMKNGGTLHTRIYCFQTDKPILNSDHIVNKSESMIKRNKTKRWIFSPAVLFFMMVIRKLSFTFLNLRVGVSRQT